MNKRLLYVFLISALISIFLPGIVTAKTEKSEQDIRLEEHIELKKRKDSRQRMRMQMQLDSSGDYTIKGNNYLEYSIYHYGDDIENGRFTIGNVLGNPNHLLDDNKILLYGHPSPWSSFTTIRIDNVDYYFESEETIFDNDKAISTMNIDGVEIKQTMEFVKSASGLDDTVKISYSTVNKSNSKKSIGIRILMDTMLGDNDGAPFKVPSLGNVTKEVELTGNAIPQYWQAFDDLNNPSVFAVGTLYKENDIKPNKVQFAYWSMIYDSLWDYNVERDVSVTGDSAVAIYWNPTDIASQQSKTVSTYYGVGYSSSTESESNSTRVDAKGLAVIVYDQANEAVPGATVTINNSLTKSTDSSGIATFTDLPDSFNYGNVRISASKSDYHSKSDTRSMAQGQLTSISIEKIESQRPVVISKVNVKLGHKEWNVLAENLYLKADDKSIEPNERNRSYLEFDVSLDKIQDIQASKFLLIQGTEIVLESSSHKFYIPVILGGELNNTRVSDLKAGKDVYLEILDENNNRLDKKKLSIKVSEPIVTTELETKGSVSMGEKLKISVPSNIPIIGDSEIELGWNAWDDMPFDIKFDEDGKVRIAINKKADKDWKEFEDEYKHMASYGRALMGKKFGGKPEPFSYGEASIDGSIMGYGEGYLTNMGEVNINIGLIMSASGSKSYTKQFVIGYVPVYVSVGGKVELSTEGTFGLIFDRGLTNPRFKGSNIEVNPKITLNLDGGVGANGVLSIGASGRATLSWLMRCSDNYNSVSLTGDMFLVASAWLFKIEKKLATGTWTIYDSFRDRRSLYSITSFDDFYDSSSYVLTDRSNNNISMLYNISMTNDTIIEALVYPEASPTLINVGEVSYLFWLHDAGDQRTSENRTALVYATSTDQRNWSAPIQVIPEIRDLDGTSLSTGELEYSLVVNNDEIHIILQKCNRVLGADITLDDLAKASDIYMVTIGRDSSAVSGSAIKSIIEDDITGVPQGSIMQDSGIAAASGSAVFITNITNFDDNAQVMPRIASDGSTVTLAWITNSMTSPGGLFGHDNTYHINYVDINDLNNIQRVQLPNGSVIAFMDIGIINNKTVIAYVLDRDGDYSTEDDRVFYIMETGSNSILMQFDEAVYNPQFIKLGNQYILAWYYNGDILYTSDLVNIQTIFGEMETDVNSSFSIISGSNGEVLLIWEATSAERGNVVFRASRYNNSNGVWSRPYNLYQTNSETTSKFDGFISQMGNPVLAYIERHSDINNLVVSNVTPKNDVSLISVGYDDDQLKRGEMLPLTLVVENTGNNIVSFLDVYVDGNSAPFANFNSLNISPGETETILVNGYVVPELLDGVEQVDINIKAYGEDNFTDNAYVMDIGYTDLSVSAEKFFMNGHNWARITVNNNSDIPSDGVLRIIADEPDGAVLYEEAFTNLTKDANLVTLSNLDTILGETIIDVFYIMVVPYAEELRTGNNTALLYLGLGREARSVQKYNVYYASNEAASGIAPTSMDYYPNEEFVLPRNTFVRVGYTFNGWSDGSRTYQEGATYVMPSRNVQFYAIWTGEDSDTPSTPGPGSSQTPAPTKDDSDKDEDIFTIDIKEFEKYIKRNKDGSLTLLIEGKDLIDLIKNDKSNTTRISLVIGSDDLSDDQLRDLSIILSKELLNAIRETGKDIIVSIEDEKNKAIYQWYFDGESLKNSKKKIDDINLALYVSSVNQNSNIQGLIDNMPNRGRQEQGYVVSFMHDGALPIVCDVRLYLGENSSFKEGDTFILYHYNPKTGKFETLPYSTYTIDKNGYITIRISHCSDYVLFPEAVSSRLITSLRNQISISSSDKTLYLSDVDNKANIQINSPEHLVEVKEISEMDKESGVGVYTVKYKSSNDKVAVVNEKGEITAKGKGTCIITTTVTLYSGKVKTVETLITVKNPYIKLVNKSSEMKTGERFTFTAKGYGIDTDDIEWTTSKRSIVVINKKSGKATAKSAGTDYVIAKHGDYEVRYKVVVK